MKKWHNKPINWTMNYGFGMLAKYPIKHSKVVILPSIEKDKKFGFMHVVAKTKKGTLDLINVHFENTDKGSKEHLRKTLKWCKERGIKPIIAGDFNMKNYKDIKEISENDYQISYIFKKYKSFMPTEFSYNKVPITLDYIISHKDKFEMKDIVCFNNDISDHNAVIAKIKIK